MTINEIKNKLENLESVKIGDLTLRLEPDEDAENPLDHDCSMATFVCFHSRYNLLGSRGHPYRSDMFNGWEDLRKAILRDNKVWCMRPLYLYDHSGLTISTTPFSCPWDSGQVGFVFYTKEMVTAIRGWKNTSANRLKEVEKMLLYDVEVYDKYLRGEVYSYVIADKDESVKDACGGFYDAESAAYACLNFSDVKLD